MRDIDQPSIELHCPNCGYNLRGTDSARCPECGVIVDRETIARSVLPWTHRASMGIVTAFVKTLWLVIRHPGRIAGEAAGPVNPRDARVFRWIVIFLAALPLCASAVGAHLINVYRPGTLEFPRFGEWMYRQNPMPMTYDLRICFLMGMRGWPVPTAAIVLFLAGITGVQVFFFSSKSISRELQDRAITLSYYMSAPLALIAIPTICWALLVAMRLRYYLFQGTPALWLDYLVGGATGAAILIVTLIANLRLLRGITKCSLPRSIATAILLPLAWIVVALLTLILFPACYGFIRLVIESYRT